MNDPLFQQGSLEEAVAALRRDILAGQISTMRNYRFAILPYRPKDEFKLRQLMRRLTDELRAEGWGVLPISLQKILLDRIRATGEENVEALITRETRLFEKDPERTSRGSSTRSPRTTPIARTARWCSSGERARSTPSSVPRRC